LLQGCWLGGGLVGMRSAPPPILLVEGIGERIWREDAA
jgi:hypothetical protein